MYIPVDVGRKDGKNDIHKTEEKKSFEEQYIGIIIGALAFLIVVLFVIVLFIIIRHKKRKHNNNRLGMKPVVDHVTMNMNHVNTFHPTLTGKMSNGTMYKGLPVDDMDEHHICNGGDKILKGYSEPKDLIQGRNLPDLPSSSEMQGRNYVCTLKALYCVSLNACVTIFKAFRSVSSHIIFTFVCSHVYIRT